MSSMSFNCSKYCCQLCRGNVGLPSVWVTDGKSVLLSVCAEHTAVIAERSSVIVVFNIAVILGLWFWLASTITNLKIIFWKRKRFQRFFSNNLIFVSSRGCKNFLPRKQKISDERRMFLCRGLKNITNINDSRIVQAIFRRLWHLRHDLRKLNIIWLRFSYNI